MRVTDASNAVFAPSERPGSGMFMGEICLSFSITTVKYDARHRVLRLQASPSALSVYEYLGFEYGLDAHE